MSGPIARGEGPRSPLSWVRLRPSALPGAALAVDDGVMNIVCERCGALIAVPNADAPVSRLAREATGSEPKSFLITTRNATGSRLLHRCVVVDDHARGRNSSHNL